MAAAKEWDLEPNNTLVVLDGGKSESDLMLILDVLVWWVGNPDYHTPPELLDDEYIIFREPDMGDEMTGFAIKPGYSHKYLLSLPLLKGGEK